VQLAATRIRRSTIEEAASVISAANRYYDDPDYLANTLKIGALRLRASKTSDEAKELEALGENIDDLSESTSKLREEMMALTGVDIMVDDKNFKSYYQQLLDISEVYQSLDETTQANVLEKMFGKNRSAAGANILKAMADSVEVYNEALQSAGSSEEEFSRWTESAEAATKRFGTAMTETYSNLLSGETVKGLANTGTALLDLSNKLGLVEKGFKGILIVGAMKGITTLTVAFKNSAIQLSNYGSALDAVKKVSTCAKDTRDYADAMKTLKSSCANLTDAQLKQVLANRNLSDSQLKEILQLDLLEEEQREARLTQLGLTQATNAQTEANGKAAASTFKFSSAVKGLGTKFKSFLAGNKVTVAIMAISAAISLVTSAIAKHNQKLEEARQKAAELAEAYKQQQSSLDSQIEKYRELKESLDKGNLSTDEARSIKEQLLEIQNSLIDSYGNEASNIDLINGKYKEQLGLLSELSKDKAEYFVTEHRKDFETAKRELEKVRTYRIGSIIPGVDDTRNGLLDYLRTYSELLDVQRTAPGEISVSVKANAEEADRLMHQLSKDLDDWAEKNGIDHQTVEPLQLGISQYAGKTMTDGLKEYKEIYDEFMKAEIIRNDTLRPLYQQSIQAVEDYNNALSAGEGVEEAKANLDSVQQSVQNVVSELEGSREIFDGIYEGINKNAEAAYNLNRAFENDETVKGYAEQLRGLTDFDLKGINFEDNVESPGEEAFGALIDVLGLSEDEVQNLIDKLAELGYVQGEVQGTFNNTSATFSMDTYKDSIDSIQSSVSTLRSALSSLYGNSMDRSAVTDLIQEFPALAPYVDLTADGFGNLAEGLHELLSQQPSALISELEKIKSNLNTEEEREQISLLIDSLQLLSTYGDTGTEAFEAATGNTWNETADVIDSVTAQFEKLAKVQETVADGLTMTATKAAELAKLYPEILTNATVAADGQITLNEEVVNGILQGDSSVIDGKIKQLEADRALLEGKKAFAETQLDILKQVGEGEGQISKEVAQYRLQVSNQLLEALIEAGLEEDRAYAAVAANMAGNMDEYNRIVAEVANDTAVNMDRAAVTMAKSISINSISAQESFDAVMDTVHQLADAVQGAANGEKRGTKLAHRSGGYTSIGGINAQRHSGNFRESAADWTAKEITLNDFVSDLELDIKGYEDAISNIDGQIAVLRNLQASFGGEIGGHNYADQIKRLENEKDAISSAAKDAAGSVSNVFREEKDEFKRYVEEVTDSLDFLKASLENVSGAYARNELINAQESLSASLLSGYADALTMYENRAQEALSGIPEDMRDAVKSGAVHIGKFVGDAGEEVLQNIEEFEKWSDAVWDTKTSMEELKKSIRQLELDKFTNIIQDFTDQSDLYGDSIELIDKKIALLKESGELIGSSYYSAQKQQSERQLAALEAGKTKLIEQLNDSLSTGRMETGTEEWLEMVNALSDVDGQILDCKKSIEEFDNSILELHTEIFDRIQEQFSNLDSELGNLGGLFDGFDVADDKGSWTKEGITQLGLLAQQYELAEYQIQQYSKEIDELNKQYMEGKYSATEYADKLAELSSSQWDCVNSSESAKNAIMDLNESRIDAEIEGIEKEIDAYKELIDAQIETLRAAKDLHDYEESIAGKTKTVTDLERQIAAMQNDSSQATIAKRKLLEEQLAEAKKELEEAEYDHSVEAQENALNKQYDQYETERNAEIEALKASLEERETLIAQSFETVKQNAGLVGQQIAQTATEHGVTVSNALISAWNQGENAIAGYGTVLSTASSAFIGNIMGVENEVWNLQSKADETAGTLAYMFSTRADSLVNELVQSYYSEENLASMTDALQNSLVNTLERGYDVSGITGAFGSIADSAQKAADAWKGYHSAASGSDLASSADITGINGKAAHGSLSKNISHTDTLKGKLGIKRFNKYAGGVHGLASHELAWTQDGGREMILSPARDAVLTPLKPGDTVLTRVQTDNMFDWSKLNPADFIQPNLNVSMPKLPETISRNIQPSVNMHYDSLVTINGDVNDTNHFIKQVTGVVERQLDRSFNDFKKEIL